MSSTPDSYKISLNVINAIKQHPVLYIPEIKGTAVKPQELRQKVWKRISNELGLETSWLKLRWKSLRDTYCRILKNKAKRLKESKRKRWIFEKHLDFLKITYQDNCNTVEVSDDYIKEMNSEDNKSNDILDQLEENEEDDYNEFLEIAKNDNVTVKTNQKQNSNNSEKSNVLKNDAESHNKQAIKRTLSEDSADESETKLQNVQLKKRKFDFSSTNFILSKKSPVKNVMSQRKVFDMSDKKKSFDYSTSIDNFFQNIAQNVKKLPPKIQADIKMDVSKIVLEAEINYFKNNLLQKVQKYNNMPGMIKKLVLVPCQMIDSQENTNKN